jgi:hypothetical protein
VVIQQVKLSEERQTAALAAFAAADAQHANTISQEGVRNALQTLGLRLDDALFERLVSNRWASVASDAGVTSEGFLVLYVFSIAPATKFGSALRKAAGRGDGKILLLISTLTQLFFELLLGTWTVKLMPSMFTCCHYN